MRAISKRRKPHTVRYYVDADTIGLAKVLLQVRGDVTYPGDPGGRWRDGRGRPACAITSTAVADREWIPEVTRRGWVIITRDQRIEERTAEVSTVLDCGAKLFTISSPQRQLSGFDILEIVMCSWRRMEAKTTDDGPFICRMTRTGIRQTVPA